MKKSLLTFGLSVSLIVSVGTVNLSAEDTNPLTGRFIYVG